jgi:hypothetical protein
MNKLLIPPFWISVFVCICSQYLTINPIKAQTSTYVQHVGTQYSFPSDSLPIQPLKVAVDYDNLVYVLTDKGLFWLFEDELIPDIRFRSLEGKRPVDIFVQEESGYLYYLYEDHFLSNAQAGKPYGAFSAGRYNQFGVNAQGIVLLLGPNHQSIYKEGKLTSVKSSFQPLGKITVHQQNFYLLAEEGVLKISPEGQVSLVVEGDFEDFAVFENTLLVGGEKGYTAHSMVNGKPLYDWQNKLPVPQVTQVEMAGRNLWMGSKDGVFFREPQGKFRYFANKRWLDHNQVIDLVADDHAEHIYILSPTGLNSITLRPTTLAEKAERFEQKIRQRHIRFGFSTETRVKNHQNLGLSSLVDDDNDGLWTSFYLGSMAFKYAHTQDPTARRYAWESFEAFERLLSVNELDGFPSRTFERTGYKVSGPTKWRPSPDKGWEWKGHTSSDEFVGYIFVAAVMDELVAETTHEKERVANFIDEILMHLIDNDYYFVDIDGAPTLWGRWNPEYINWYPETVVDRKLGSITLIAGLQLGYALTGKSLYREEAERLMKEHGYLENIMIDLNRISSTPDVIHEGHNMGDGGWNHSDDEMAFLSYWVLYHYAFDETLKDKFAWVIRNHWEIELPERNALWSLITYATEGSIDKESVFWHLEGFPWDLVRHDLKNSHRKDLEFLPENFRGQTTADLLHPDERAIERHNSNPFRLDEGRGGNTELTGDEFLLPYWMGKFLGIL